MVPIAISNLLAVGSIKYPVKLTFIGKQDSLPFYSVTLSHLKKKKKKELHFFIKT